MGAFAIVCVVLLWILIAGLKSAFKKQTGVDMLFLSANKRINRREREQGITHAEALDAWVWNKQKLAA